jgi:hypothetical protein
MEWFKIFDLVSIVLLLFCLYQLYRLRKEFQKLSRLQNASDESVRKWSKRLMYNVCSKHVSNSLWSSFCFFKVKDYTNG